MNPNMPTPRPSGPPSLCDVPVGVGLGLRRENLDELLDLLDASDPRLATLAFFELSPENFMRRGGFLPAAADRVRESFPILSHGLAMSLGGVDRFDERYFTELRAYLKRIRPPFHSEHLSFCGMDGCLHDLLPVPITRAGARHMATRVAEARDRLAMPFALENITHYLVPGRDHAFDEAAFIGDVIEASGAHLLLDVNNVYVNSQNYGFDPVAFLERLPLHRVIEVHVAGHEYWPEDGLILDTHGAAVADAVLELLAWTVERTGPVAVLLERDHNVPGLAALLDEVDSIRGVYLRGLAARSASHDRVCDAA